MKRSSKARIWKDARTRIAMSLRLWPLALRLLDLLADGAGLLLANPRRRGR